MHWETQLCYQVSSDNLLVSISCADALISPVRLPCFVVLREGHHPHPAYGIICPSRKSPIPRTREAWKRGDLSLTSRIHGTLMLNLVLSDRERAVVHALLQLPDRLTRRPSTAAERLA